MLIPAGRGVEVEDSDESSEKRRKTVMKNTGNVLRRLDNKTKYYVFVSKIKKIVFLFVNYHKPLVLSKKFDKNFRTIIKVYK